MHSYISSREEILPFDYALKIEHWSVLPATIWHDIHNIKCKHTYLIFPLGHPNFLQQLSWLKDFQSLICFTFSHHTIIPWIPQVWKSCWNTCFLSWSMNLLMKIPSKNLEDLAYPHQQMFPFDKMYDTPCTRWPCHLCSNEIPKNYILDFHRF